MATIINRFGMQFTVIMKLVSNNIIFRAQIDIIENGQRNFQLIKSSIQ